MKIDRSFHTAKKRQSHEGAEETGSTRNRRFTRRGDTGSDRVEISTQAKERYEREQKAREALSASKKYISALIDRSDSSLVRERHERIKYLKEDIRAGRYDADDGKKIKGAAEKLAAWLLHTNLK